MKVFVYHSLKKSGYYLYVANKDDFSPVPEALLPRLGKLEFALEFELDKNRRLATENPQTVIDNLKSTGYHLQITDPLGVPHTVDKAPINRD